MSSFAGLLLREIESGTYLTGDHMDKFGEMLERQTTFRYVSTFYIQHPGLIQPVPTPHIQLLFSSKQLTANDIGHFITVYHDGHHLYVYDSLNGKCLTADQKIFLDRLFPNSTDIPIFISVKPQENLIDCGVFAIANATALALGLNPAHQNYDVSKMRPHLASMLRSGLLTPFPTLPSISLPALPQVVLPPKQIESIPAVSSRECEQLNGNPPILLFSYEDFPPLPDQPPRKRGRPTKVAVVTSQTNQKIESIPACSSHVSKMGSCEVLTPISNFIPEEGNMGKVEEVNSLMDSEDHVSQFPIVTENHSSTGTVNPDGCSDVLPDQVNRGKKRRKRFTNINRTKQHRKSVKSYNERNPEVNREAVKRYNEKNPEVHREAVKKYNEKNPEVNLEAVKKYNEKNPEVHREAVKKYNEKNPEVNREAVKKYNEKNPDVNREAVKKYVAKKPDIHCAAVQKYEAKQSQMKMLPWIKKNMSGFQYNINTDYNKDKAIVLGNMTSCKWCKARKWNEEPPGLCCSKGKVNLPHIQPPPEPLYSLLKKETPHAEHFLSNIRQYNSCFQMTSFGANIIQEGNFMPTFKVQGQVYHLIGSLLPQADQQPSFLQIYFVGDEERECNLRCNNAPSVKPWLVSQLQNMFHQCNPYVKELKTAMEKLPKGKDFQVHITADRKPAGAHKGRYNRPATSEVALVIVGQSFEKRDIVLHGRDSRLVRINETHRSYDALQYPLMFCHGEDGYSVDIPQVDPNTKVPQKKTVSASSFYSYMMMERDGLENLIFHYRNLLNQYLTDMYAKIETERLNFLRHNQSKLRVEQYMHLRDALNKNDAQASDLGKIVILPSSFTGGPRYMHERTQDAMCYVRHYGRPDLFITFTCNPKWPEIQELLHEGQAAHCRNDIIARVFHLKVKKMVDLLNKGSIFGPTRCYMYTIEWQKRGLPHVHILLWLINRIPSSQTDSIIRAEIPDPNSDPTLHEIVKSTMIHGPCGVLNQKSPCMANGSCSKRYPRPLTKETQTAEDGYPQYRRRSPSDGGFTASVKNLNLDNQWVVPYNPVLLRTFQAHINVELCNSVKSIKYICKYVNKGSDQASFGLQNELDEVTRYESGRYISSSEAAWRIFGFPIHERYPPVMHLSVHLENGQRVYFNPENVEDKIKNPPMTTLMGFFDLCKVDSFARGLLYSEIPAYYVWKNNKFCRRKNGKSVPGHLGVKQDNVLGRVYTIHPSNTECFYLRLLLHEIRGPTSFNDLKEVEGIVHSSFQSACRALGLLEDDSHWHKTLEEASLSRLPQQIRELFSMMLVFCQVADAANLWESFKDSMSDDVKRTLLRESPEESHLDIDVVYNKTLSILQDLIYAMSGHGLKQYGLTIPLLDQTNDPVNRELVREVSYDVQQLSEYIKKHEPNLNEDQTQVYNTLMANVNCEQGRLFFLDAPGGTGKTFLINLLLATVRKDRHIALAVASSGIAATLLSGGKTAHSALKLPLDLNRNETPMCNISKQSDMAEVLQQCKLIVWDEITMAHKGGLEALDRTLQDLRGNRILMGGVTVLLAGDFRQTLPVVPRGTRADEIKACIRSSYLWPFVTTLNLTINMRVHVLGHSKAKLFSDLLLQIGNGQLPESNGKISIPDMCAVVSQLQEFTENIYPNLNAMTVIDPIWLRERAILTPTNECTNNMNDILLDQVSGKEMKYESVDCVLESEDAVHYPVEFLHTLNPPGLPPHSLRLKVGAPIMLLRNIKPPKLCNGTRLQVKSLHNHIIEAIVITGAGEGETVFIPRIPLIPSDYHFTFKRLQFPVKVCFAMTINKAQGQSLNVAGVDLQRDCFSHGQLYVACSRVSSPDNLFIFAPDRQTANVVYGEVLK